MFLSNSTLFNHMIKKTMEMKTGCSDKERISDLLKNTCDKTGSSGIEFPVMETQVCSIFWNFSSMKQYTNTAETWKNWNRRPNHHVWMV